jgi:hypothetical protein
MHDWLYSSAPVQQQIKAPTKAHSMPCAGVCTVEVERGLAQLVRFLVMKLTHLDSNSKFDMSVVFMYV